MAAAAAVQRGKPHLKDGLTALLYLPCMPTIQAHTQISDTSRQVSCCGPWGHPVSLVTTDRKQSTAASSLLPLCWQRWPSAAACWLLRATAGARVMLQAAESYAALIAGGDAHLHQCNRHSASAPLRGAVASAAAAAASSKLCRCLVLVVLGSQTVQV